MTENRQIANVYRVRGISAMDETARQKQLMETATTSEASAAKSALDESSKAAEAVPAQEPLVSVVVPVYNGEKFLVDALDSVLSQSYQNWEMVLIDNASTDRTPTLIARYIALDDRVRSVRNPKTVSVIENHNVAVANMSDAADYCKVLHADDTLEKDALARMVALAEEHPSAALVGCWAQWGDRVVSQISPFHQSFFTGQEIGQRTLMGEFYPFISPSVLLLRASTLRERGVFYQGRALHADVEMAFDLLASNDFAIEQSVMVHVRAHDTSVTASQAEPLNTLIASNLRLLGQYGNQFLEPAALRKRFAQRIRRYYNVLARAWLEGRGEEFWSYHSDALEAVGRPLSLARVRRRALGMVVRHPKHHLRTLLKRFTTP